jgi:DNA repair protein RadA/Sms
LIEEAPAAAPPDVRRGGVGASPHVAVPEVRTLGAVDARDEERLATGLGEFDRVLGGGLVKGSVVLVGGEPGIGKSTLLLQTLLGLQQAGVATLLVSGEESAGQVKLRARRLSEAPDALPLICETEVEAVVACLEAHAPAVCVIDSVQTLWSSALTSAPGSVSQIREATGRLLRVVKATGTTLVLVGHVTKSGDLAGPRVLEHMVDVVLAFEGDRGQPFRILRGSKNRFGATNEVGVFSMTGRGLEDVPDPSALFLDEAEPTAGSAVVAAIEGTRCLLAEVQALVVPTTFAMPRRVTRGVEANRLAMVVAVLSRRAGLGLGECDIFVNVAGGLSLEDPGADLPVALAVASAWRDKTVTPGLAAFGELSLTGQLRYVAQGEKRMVELARRGFERVVMPRRNAEELRARGAVPRGVTLDVAHDIRDVLRGAVG